MGATQRIGDYMTTDLLCEWTDPDTAMELVGTSIGIFDARVPNPRAVLSSDTPMRAALFKVLLDLVDGGALEKRALSDGRYAFRWRADIASAAVTPSVTTPPLAVVTSAPATTPPATEPGALTTGAPDAKWWHDPDPPLTPSLEEPLAGSFAASSTAASSTAAQPAAPVAEPSPPRPKLIAQAALIALPALSCLLAVLAFEWFDRPIAIALAAALAVVGVIGVVKRTPFAGLWTMGLVLAGLLLRFS